MKGPSFLPRHAVLLGPRPNLEAPLSARRLGSDTRWRVDGGADALLTLAEAHRETHRVWLYRYDEATGIEATAEWVDGAWVEARVRADQDETFVRLAEDHETPVWTLHRYVWRHWPISELVRSLGLETRAWLIRPTGRLAVGGPVPEDVAPPWIHCIMDLPEDLHDAIRDQALADGASFSRTLADALTGTPEDPVELPPKATARTEVLYLPRPLHEAITETASRHGVTRAQVVAARWRTRPSPI